MARPFGLHAYFPYKLTAQLSLLSPSLCAWPLILAPYSPSLYASPCRIVFSASFAASICISDLCVASALFDCGLAEIFNVTSPFNFVTVPLPDQDMIAPLFVFEIVCEVQPFGSQVKPVAQQVPALRVCFLYPQDWIR